MRILRKLLSVGVIVGLFVATIALSVLSVLLDGVLAFFAAATGAAAGVAMWLHGRQGKELRPPELTPERDAVPGMDWGVAKEAVRPTIAGQARDWRFADEDEQLLRVEEQREQLSRGWRGEQ